MWKKELSDHQKRLTTVKTTLQPAAPASSRPATQSMRTPAKRLGSPTQTLKSTPRATTAASGGTAATPPFDATISGRNSPNSKLPGKKIEDLTPEDQKTCEAMVVLLQRLSTQDCKSIVEELFVATEMKRLLNNYSGVYPTDLGENVDENGKGKGSSATTAGASHQATKPPASPKEKAQKPQQEKVAATRASTTTPSSAGNSITSLSVKGEPAESKNAQATKESSPPKKLSVPAKTEEPDTNSPKRSSVKDAPAEKNPAVHKKEEVGKQSGTAKDEGEAADEAAPEVGSTPKKGSEDDYADEFDN